MATVVNELQRGTAKRSVKGRSYTRVFQVIADAATDTAAASYAVPVTLGNPHPADPLASCKDIDSKPFQDKDHRRIFVVTCKYETGTGSGDEPEENEDPTQDHPEISWGSRTIQIPVSVAIDPNDPDSNIAVANSAGQPFIPSPVEDFHITTYTYTVNGLTFDAQKAQDYRGAINSGAFNLAGLMVGQYAARVQSISATNAERNGVKYWRETTTIEITDDWRLLIHDAGLMKLDEVAVDDPRVEGGQIVGVQLSPILGIDNLPITTPVPLDGAGQPAAEGAKPVILPFNTRAKPLKDLAALGLPTTNTP